MEPLHTASDHHETIQIKAYFLWQERGCPIGSSEVDWFHAEELEYTPADQSSVKPTMVGVAKVVGSALGSVAGLVASVSSLVHSEGSATPD